MATVFPIPVLAWRRRCSRSSSADSTAWMIFSWPRRSEEWGKRSLRRRLSPLGSHSALALEAVEAGVDVGAKGSLQSRKVEGNRLAGDACAADLDPEQLGADWKTAFSLEHPGVEGRLETVNVAAFGVDRRTPPHRLDLFDDETSFRVFTDPVGASMEQNLPPGVVEAEPKSDLASVGGVSSRGRRLDSRVERLSQPQPLHSAAPGEADAGSAPVVEELGDGDPQSSLGGIEMQVTPP